MASHISPHCLVGWDTGESWSPEKRRPSGDRRFTLHLSEANL
ncbi:MAG: hypothetical protein ACXWZT_06360 [Gaiellaceae bacterium]